MQRVSEQAVGEKVLKSLNPSQQVVGIVYQELVNLMGPVDHSLHLKGANEVTVLMMCGLQGSGKTTTTGKLGRMLKARGRRPLLVACDLQRPAAIDQLNVLGEQLEIPVYSDRTNKDPVAVANAAVREAKKHNADVVILDTAGRLHIDDALMNELVAVRDGAKPHLIYLVADAMTGQDAVQSSAAFHERIGLTGVVLTKLDGDARGGAALSIRHVTGRPVVMVGVGEKLDALEPFHPERMAGRILGMGDIVSLVEEAQDKIDQDEARQVTERMFKESFNLEDMLLQLEQVRKMGNIRDLMKKLPGQFSEMAGEDFDESELDRSRAIIQSMTPWERYHPDEIHAQRRNRVARGSGTPINQVNDLIKQFTVMRKQMKGLKDTFMGRVGLKQLEKRKAKMLKAMKDGKIPGMPGL
jgi:signal recognition particle subunit SRP54